MTRKVLKPVLWVALTPLLLFILLMVLLYVPPVQNVIRRQATSIASEATGLDITVDRIDLRFPLNLLVRGVSVVQPSDSVTSSVQPGDTLFHLKSLNVRVQAWPLLKGHVEVDNVTLEEVSVNSAHLLDGMSLRGQLGYFFFQSHGVDLRHEEATINQVELHDTRLQVVLSDTTAVPEDTSATALKWKVLLRALRLKNVAVDVQMPFDSLYLSARVGRAEVDDALADLDSQRYGWQHFLLEESSVSYDTGAPLSSGREWVVGSDTLRASTGFDPSHIALRNVRMAVDSLYYGGRDVRAIIREMSMNERCGLHIASLTGRLLADSTRIQLPSLRLLTPHSEMNLTAQTYWKLVDIPTEGHLSVRFDARIGKQDVFLLAGDLPESFKAAYPFRPLVIRAGTEGNLKQMQISRFMAELPGAFTLGGGGEFWNLNDSVRRSGNVDIEIETQDLNFLTALTGNQPDYSLVVPDSMKLAARFTLDGPHCTAGMKLQEGGGLLDLAAAYNLTSEAYQADLTIDGLQVDHFLPRDSIYTLSARMSAKGRGTDFLSPHSVALFDASLEALRYGHWDISGINLRASLRSSVAEASFISNNTLLQMQAGADIRLDRRYLDGKLDVEVGQVDLYKLGVAPRPLKRPFAFTLGAEARRDSIRMNLQAGDLDFRFRARSTMKKLVQQWNTFAEVLTQQIDERRLDHAALRRALPSAGMHLRGGKENPVSYFLATKDISYDDFKLSFGFTPQVGINGRTALHGLRMDSLQLDTIFFAIRQDTARMTLQGGVCNGPQNPRVAFRSTLTGEIRNEDAELTLHYADEKGDTGVLFGINARPLTEGHGKGNGLLLNLTPAEPVIAFRKFRFVDKSNWIYLHKNMRVYANVDMDSDDGLCFRMQSNRDDTLSLQNINVELSRLRLEELCKVLPYMPRMSGLFTVEANYVQTATSLQVAAEANVDRLTYERQLVGDIGVGATWLPGEKDVHYLNTYFSYNGEEVATADGVLTQQAGKDSLDVTALFEHFPLQMANAFMPEQMVAFTGDVDGEVALSGALESPLIEGSVTLDSVSVYARQAGARYWFDNRPLQIRGNRLLFDQFAIYTTSKNPFTINGTVDFRNLERPTANLDLLARNYTLLDAPRTRESLVYGKVFVDLQATLRGPLDALTMRGNMHLLGNTNVTYVLTDSPLTVEDRLDGLVTFTSFRDTTSVAQEAVPTMSLGGMEMNMSVRIDDAVRLRADLSPDRSKFIELEGGGDLNMQYTPQGDMSLTGRYTLSGGMMKYSLPIIPLKEFQFNPGSYVDWRGNVMNPTLNLKATERMRASVSDGSGDASRMVNFDVSIAIRNRLEAPDLVFDISAPEDATVENELQSMGADERSKQAIAMLATGIYMNSGLKGGGLSMGTALNSVLQSQINALAGSARNASISVGIEDRTSSETGDTQKDFSFRYSQRFFNDRVQIVIGGKVSTGANATNNVESFIDNISLEYRLDQSGTRYVRVFHNKNYESVLDGEITETGAGLVLRRKMDRLSELFIFRRRGKEKQRATDVNEVRPVAVKEEETSL